MSAEGDRLRDEGIARTVLAHPEAFDTALGIIVVAARRLPSLDANTVRAAMDEAQIPGPVRGGAFRKAVIDGVLSPAGYVKSTQPTTHSHPVRTYLSAILQIEPHRHDFGAVSSICPCGAIRPRSACGTGG